MNALSGIVAADMTPEVNEPLVMRQIEGRAYRVPQGINHRLRVTFESDHVGDITVPACIRQSIQQMVEIACGCGTSIWMDVLAKEGANIRAQPMRVIVS